MDRPITSSLGNMCARSLLGYHRTRPGSPTSLAAPPSVSSSPAVSQLLGWALIPPPPASLGHSIRAHGFILNFYADNSQIPNSSPDSLNSHLHDSKVFQAHHGKEQIRDLSQTNPILFLCCYLMEWPNHPSMQQKQKGQVLSFAPLLHSILPCSPLLWSVSQKAREKSLQNAS